MLTYSFRDIGTDSLYEYLYKCIRKDILDGKIAAGTRLPSKRSFAKNLGISVITVENAYAQLVAEGYIYSVPKSGYYVEQIRKNLLMPESSAGEKCRMAGSESNQPRRMCGAESGRSGWISGNETERNGQVYGSKKENGQIASTYRIDLVSGRTDPKKFPFTIWARLLREVLSGEREALMNNAPGGGILELRRAIAGYLLQYQGMQVSEEQIIIGAGTEYLYGLLIQLLGQDKTYALEDPGYTKVAKIYQSHLVKTAFIPMDEQGVRIDRLRESGADVMHISPSHHYPTGITTPIGRRYELLAWANEKEGRYILEDDYDCEFRLAGRPIPSLQSIDQLGRVIYMNTFTKSLTSTIRISYMVLPWDLLEHFQNKLGFYACTVSNFEQYTLARFISGGYFEKHINRMRNYYRGKRDELIKQLQTSPLGEKIAILGADAGLHFLMEVDTALSDGELVELAGKEGIRLSCLSGYYHTSRKGRGFRREEGLMDEELVPQEEEGLMNEELVPQGEESLRKEELVLQGEKGLRNEELVPQEEECLRKEEMVSQREGAVRGGRHFVVVNYSGLDSSQMELLPDMLYRAWF